MPDPHPNKKKTERKEKRGTAKVTSPTGVTVEKFSRKESKKTANEINAEHGKKTTTARKVRKHGVKVKI